MSYGSVEESGDGSGEGSGDGSGGGSGDGSGEGSGLGKSHRYDVLKNFNWNNIQWTTTYNIFMYVFIITVDRRRRSLGDNSKGNGCTDSVACGNGGNKYHIQ